MKAANLLVFRTQEVKLGDLGVSIKLDDSDTDGTECKYYLKGKTEGYVTQEIEKAEEADQPVSKQQLFRNDRYALQVTFEKAAAAVESLNIAGSSAYYLQMVEDLKTHDLVDIVTKWRDTFAKDTSYTDTMVKQMKHENKPYALQIIYLVSKFAEPAKFMLKKDFGSRISSEQMSQGVYDDDEINYMIELNAQDEFKFPTQCPHYCSAEFDDAESYSVHIGKVFPPGKEG